VRGALVERFSHRHLCCRAPVCKSDGKYANPMRGRVDANHVMAEASCSGRRHKAEHDAAGHAGDWSSVGIIALQHDFGSHRKPRVADLDLPAVVDLPRLNRTTISDRATGVTSLWRPQRAIPFAHRARRVGSFRRGSNGQSLPPEWKQRLQPKNTRPCRSPNRGGDVSGAGRCAPCLGACTCYPCLCQQGADS
jgi:hypothetical protein